MYKKSQYECNRQLPPNRFEKESLSVVNIDQTNYVGRKYDKPGVKALIGKLRKDQTWQIQSILVPKQKYVNKIMKDGGELPTTTIAQRVAEIAKRNNKSVYDIVALVQDGAKVELEHADTAKYIQQHPQLSKEKAAELISLDHLKESINYYSKLAKMEETFENGGKMANGGLVKGKSHAQGGVPAVDENTGQQVAEIEGGEAVIKKTSVTDSIKHKFDGKDMSNKQILSSINQETGGKPIMADGGEIKPCDCKMKDGGSLVDGHMTEFLGAERHGFSRISEYFGTTIYEGFYHNNHFKITLDNNSWEMVRGDKYFEDEDKVDELVDWIKSGDHSEDKVWQKSLMETTREMKDGGNIEPMSYDEWFSKIHFYKSGGVDSYKLPDGTRGIGKKDNSAWFHKVYSKLNVNNVSELDPTNMTLDEFTKNQLEFVKGKASGFSAKDEWFVIIHKDKAKSGKPETSRSRKLERGETPSWDGLNSYSKDFIKGIHQSLINNRILVATGNKPKLDVPTISIGLELKKEGSSDIYEISRLEQDEVCITKRALFKGESNPEICTSWDELIENINNNLIKADGFETNKEFALAVQSYLAEQEKQQLIQEKKQEDEAYAKAESEQFLEGLETRVEEKQSEQPIIGYEDTIARINKLDEYESQGYQVTHLRKLKQQMLEDPKKAKLAFEIFDFTAPIWKMEKEFAARPLGMIGMFFYGDATTLAEYIVQQTSAAEQEIVRLKKYISELGKSKTDARQKAFYESQIAEKQKYMKELNDSYNSKKTSGDKSQDAIELENANELSLIELEIALDEHADESANTDEQNIELKAVLKGDKIVAYQHGNDKYTWKKVKGGFDIYKNEVMQDRGAKSKQDIKGVIEIIKNSEKEVDQMYSSDKKGVIHKSKVKGIYYLVSGAGSYKYLVIMHEKSNKPLTRFTNSPVQKVTDAIKKADEVLGALNWDLTVEEMSDKHPALVQKLKDAFVIENGKMVVKNK